jgi:hypothetical protein
LSSGSLTLNQLEDATKGLLFQSESDYPLIPFLWENFGPEPITSISLLDHIGKSANTPVETDDLDYFFRNSTKDKDWHGPEQKEEVQRFRYLVKILKENLSDIQVFRVGSVEIDVYIVGRIDSNKFMGLSTKVIET